MLVANILKIFKFLLSPEDAVLRRLGVAQSSEGDSKTRSKYINTNSDQLWQKHQDALVEKGKASGGGQGLLFWSCDNHAEIEQTKRCSRARKAEKASAGREELFVLGMVVHGHPGSVHKQ